MKYLKQEGGYAMLIVIGVMLLFTTIGMGLLAMNINASKQFKIKEEQVQARHQAEMGLLHYQAALSEKVENYTFIKRSGESNASALKRSRTELCAAISTVEAYSEYDSAIKYSVDVPSVDGCNTTSADEKITINAYSKGEAYDNVEKVVKGTITFNPPVVTDSTGAPGKPLRPPGVPIVTDPADVLDESTLSKHIEINGPYKQKKQQVFVESFIINKNPPNKSEENTFEVSGGSGDKITVEKDFFIDGNAHVQNHVCMLVKGNLTINGPLSLGTQSEIIVLGNAYINSASFSGNSSEKSIKVAGNAFQGNNKNPTNRYKWNGEVKKNASCKPPSDWTNPYVPEGGENNFDWIMGDELNPEYLN